MIILGDGDAAGKKFSADVSKDLDRHYVENIAVDLPDGMDINALLQKGGVDAVKDLVGL